MNHVHVVPARNINIAVVKIKCYSSHVSINQNNPMLA